MPDATAPAEIAPDFAAVKTGLIPITPQERLKLQKDGLDVVHDIYRYAKHGFHTITEEDFDRFKWYGVYRQKPKDSGYFMLRTKIPGGQLTSAQAILLSELANRYGRGFCDITTRQTIQMHWLRIENIPEIFYQLDHVGITTSGACGDDTRNVCGCPVAGIDAEEILDGTEPLLEVSRQLTNNREFSNLPRKYKISIGGCHLHCTQPDINCVGIFGVRQAQSPGFGIMVGGGLSSAPHLALRLPVFFEPEQVWPVVHAVSCIYRDHGYRHARNKARFKFLVKDWGAEKMLAQIESLLGYQLKRQEEFPIVADQEADHLGVHKQKQPGLNWVGVSFAGGRIRNQELADIARLAAKYAKPGHDAIRLTNKQNLLILNVPHENVADLCTDLGRYSFNYAPSNFRQGLVSCTGIEFCNLAVSETKNRAMHLVDQLEKTCGWYRGKLRIHFSGCPSSCGQHQIADIGFRGAKTKVNGEMVDAYDMFIGGRLGKNRRFNELLKGKILAANVHLAIDNILRFYEKHKIEGETFAEFCDRVPKTEIAQSLSQS